MRRACRKGACEESIIASVFNEVLAVDDEGEPQVWADLLAQEVTTKIAGGWWTLGAGGEKSKDTIHWWRDVIKPILEKRKGTIAMKPIAKRVDALKPDEAMADAAVLRLGNKILRDVFGVIGDGGREAGSIYSWLLGVLKRAETIELLPPSDGQRKDLGELRKAVRTGFKDAGAQRRLLLKSPVHQAKRPAELIPDTSTSCELLKEVDAGCVTSRKEAEKESYKPDETKAEAMQTASPPRGTDDQSWRNEQPWRNEERQALRWYGRLARSFGVAWIDTTTLHFGDQCVTIVEGAELLAAHREKRWCVACLMGSHGRAKDGWCTSPEYCMKQYTLNGDPHTAIAGVTTTAEKATFDTAAEGLRWLVKPEGGGGGGGGGRGGGKRKADELGPSSEWSPRRGAKGGRGKGGGKGGKGGGKGGKGGKGGRGGKGRDR